MIILRCDRCGGDIKQVNDIHEAMERAQKAALGFNFNGTWHDADLCDSCKMQLAEWLTVSPARCQPGKAVDVWKEDTTDIKEEKSGKSAARQQATQKESTPRQQGKGLDDALIQKLRKNGWTLKAIGQRLGCSDQTILNHLRKMGVK